MAFCPNCGSQLIPGSRFCASCGAPQEAQPQQPPQPRPQPQQAYTPQPQQAYTPQPQQAYTPQPQQAYTPQPQAQPSYNPQPRPQYAPQPGYTSYPRPQAGAPVAAAAAKGAKKGLIAIIAAVAAVALIAVALFVWPFHILDGSGSKKDLKKAAEGVIEGAEELKSFSFELEADIGRESIEMNGDVELDLSALKDMKAVKDIKKLMFKAHLDGSDNGSREEAYVLLEKGVLTTADYSSVWDEWNSRTTDLLNSYNDLPRDQKKTVDAVFELLTRDDLMKMSAKEIMDALPDMLMDAAMDELDLGVNQQMFEEYMDKIKEMTLEIYEDMTTDSGMKKYLGYEESSSGGNTTYTLKPDIYAIAEHAMDKAADTVWDMYEEMGLTSAINMSKSDYNDMMKEQLAEMKDEMSEYVIKISFTINKQGYLTSATAIIDAQGTKAEITLTVSNFNEAEVGDIPEFNEYDW